MMLGYSGSTLRTTFRLDRSTCSTWAAEGETGVSARTSSRVRPREGRAFLDAPSVQAPRTRLAIVGLSYSGGRGARVGIERHEDKITDVMQTTLTAEVADYAAKKEMKTSALSPSSPLRLLP